MWWKNWIFRNCMCELDASYWWLNRWQKWSVKQCVLFMCLIHSWEGKKKRNVGKGRWIFTHPSFWRGPGSSVSIVTGYGLDGPGIESWFLVGARFSAPIQTSPGAHPASCTRGTRSFLGVKRSRGMMLTPSPPSSALVKKEYSYTSTPPMDLTACTEPQCLYSTAIPLLPSVPVQYSYTSTPLSACTVQLYLYSPQYLYSTAIPILPSVPVQYSYTSTPPMGCTACTVPQCLYSTSIPLLPILVVRPVQTHSACTVQLYLYSPYGPYGLYTASVPVQYSYTSTPPMDRTACTEPQCLYSTAIPLLPLWAVQPVQSLSACTVQLYLYSPYWPYGLYRASVPVQWCILPLPHITWAWEQNSRRAAIRMLTSA